MNRNDDNVVNTQHRPSPLIVGSVTGGLIGMALVLLSIFTGVIFELPFMMFAAGILGFCPGGIFAPITAPFVKDMDSKQVVMVLAGGTFIAGSITLIIGFIRTGDNFVILSWPVGILGYWFSFVFRKELVWIIDRIHNFRQQEKHTL